MPVTKQTKPSSGQHPYTRPTRATDTGDAWMAWGPVLDLLLLNPAAPGPATPGIAAPAIASPTVTTHPFLNLVLYILDRPHVLEYLSARFVKHLDLWVNLHDLAALYSDELHGDAALALRARVFIGIGCSPTVPCAFWSASKKAFDGVAKLLARALGTTPAQVCDNTAALRRQCLARGIFPGWTKAPSVAGDGDDLVSGDARVASVSLVWHALDLVVLWSDRKVAVLSLVGARDALGGRITSSDDPTRDGAALVQLKSLLTRELWDSPLTSSAFGPLPSAFLAAATATAPRAWGPLARELADALPDALPLALVGILPLSAGNMSSLLDEAGTLLDNHGAPAWAALRPALQAQPSALRAYFAAETARPSFSCHICMERRADIIPFDCRCLVVCSKCMDCMCSKAVWNPDSLKCPNCQTKVLLQ